MATFSPFPALRLSQAPKSLKSLPSKLLLKIFTSCSSSDLLSLSLTCRKFNSLISNSIQLLEKFQLHFDESHKDQKWIGLRFYFNLTLDGDLASHYQATIENIADTITSLELNICLGANLEDMLAVLNALKNLKVLKIFMLDIFDLLYDQKAMEFLETPEYELNLLEFYGDPKFLQIFSQCEVKVLKLWSVGDEKFSRMEKKHKEDERCHKAIDWTSCRNFLDYIDFEHLIFEHCWIPKLSYAAEYRDRTIKSVTFVGTKFTERIPFDFEVEIKKLEINGSDTDWLIELLEQDDTTIEHLTVRNCEGDWRLKWALDVYEEKFEELWTDFKVRDEEVTEKIDTSVTEPPAKVRKIEESDRNVESSSKFNEIAQSSNITVKVGESSSKLPEETAESSPNSSKLPESSTLEEDKENSSDDESSSNSSYSSESSSQSCERSERAPKSLDSLPTEILIKIFKPLSFKSQLSLSQVCKRFLQITSTLSNFGLKLEDTKILTGFREYKSVQTEGDLLQFYDPLYQKIGKFVTELQFVSLTWVKASTFFHALRNFPNLKTLDVNGAVDLKILDEIPTYELEVENFEFSGWFFAAFKHIRTENFKLFLSEDAMQFSVREIHEFLLNQENLKSLTIENHFPVDCTLFEDPIVVHVEFRLEKFSIKNVSLDDEDSKFPDFLKLHKDSLKFFSFERENYFEIVKDFPNLREISVRNLNNFNLPVCEFVEDLTLKSCAGNFDGTFPNLRKLQLHRIDSSLDFLEDLKQLESLEIHSGGDFQFSPPKSLKVLTIFEFSEAEAPFDFPGNKIEELNLENFKPNALNFLAEFLQHVEGRKVKIKIKDSALNLSTQYYLEAFKEKISKLTLEGCIMKSNDDDEEESSDEEVETESSEEESEDEESASEDEDDYIIVMRE